MSLPFVQEPMTMASREFDPKTGKARLFFRYGGKQFNRTIPLRPTTRPARLRSDRGDDPGPGAGQADDAP